MQCLLHGHSKTFLATDSLSRQGSSLPSLLLSVLLLKILLLHCWLQKLSGEVACPSRTVTQTIPIPHASGLKQRCGSERGCMTSSSRAREKEHGSGQDGNRSEPVYQCAMPLHRWQPLSPQPRAHGNRQSPLSGSTSQSETHNGDSPRSGRMSQQGYRSAGSMSSQGLLAPWSTASLLSILHGCPAPWEEVRQKEERLQIREDAGEMSCSQIDTLGKSGSRAQPK